MEEKLKAKIQSSHISEEDKKRWFLFISLLDEPLLKDVTEAIENPEDFLFLTNNLREKQGHFLSESPDAWRKILEKEVNYLASLPEASS